MKIKTVKIPDGSKGPALVMIKDPQFWMKEVTTGEQFEVPDHIGHALLAKNPGMFQVLAYGEGKPEPVESPLAKLTKKVVETSKHA
jgi:hypothetical protein